MLVDVVIYFVVWVSEVGYIFCYYVVESSRFIENEC
jgi:hypothetical protein